jgi:hypothetical protein
MTTPELEPKDMISISKKTRNPLEHAYLVTNTTSLPKDFIPLSPQELYEWDSERTRIGDPYFEFVGDGSTKCKGNC